MEKYKITEQQLLDLIDGKCSTTESRIIKDSLQASPTLNTRYKELCYMHESMLKHTLIKSPTSFLESVMTGLESKELIIEGLFNSINKIGLRLLTVFIALMMTTIYFVSVDSVNLNFSELLTKFIGLNTFKIDASPIVKFFNDKFIINGFLFVGLVISLTLFDRVVLRPWFHSRKAV